MTDKENSETTEHEDRGEAPDKRKWRLIALAVLLAGVGLAAALYFLRPQQEASEPPDRPPLVSVQTVQAQDTPIVITGRGTVRSANELGVSLQVSGRVVYVNPALAEGGRVQRGETLVRVEPDDFRNRVLQSQAQVERAQVDLQQALETRETRREEFERLRERLADIGETGEDGALEADFVRAGEEEKEQNQAESELIEPSPLALGQPQVDAARAALEGAKAQLRNARLDVRRTSVSAPFDAIVRSESVERGQFVRAGEEIAKLYNSGSVEIPVPLTHEKAALIPQLFAPARSGRAGGSPATVKVDFGGATYAWDAQVDGAEGEIDTQTRTLDVIVRVARPVTGGRLVSEDGAASGTPPLLPGFFATVEFIADTPPSYFTIASDAVRADNRVWIAREGRVALALVRVIARDGNDAFVTSDALQSGDMVVTGDVAAISEGMQIRTSRDTQAPSIAAQQEGGEAPRYEDSAQ